ncbi:NUDIX domain-containing protein [Nostocoides australiense]|nr:NUDIX hydrolase [Tetrasphaera australiensis]
MAEKPLIDIRWDEDKRRKFIETHNDRLPTKRIIAQGILRNERGEVLLCQLTYKQEWDLPGGIVDKFESPAHCVARECREELGVDLPVGELLTTSWLPPYRGWDDAVAFIFDLGVAQADLEARMTLQRREISAVHWVGPADLDAHAAPYAARLIRSALAADRTAYLENGESRS